MTFFVIIDKNWKFVNHTGPLVVTVTRPCFGIFFAIDVVSQFHKFITLLVVISGMQLCEFCDTLRSLPGRI